MDPKEGRRPIKRIQASLQLLATFGFMLLIIALPWSIAPMSIGAAICGTTTLLLWFLPRGPKPEPTPVLLAGAFWMLALFIVAWCALDRSASLPRLGKGLFPALVVLAAFHAARRQSGERALAWLFCSSAGASIFGMVFFVSAGGGFLARARGPAGHYMTYGGQLLLMVTVAVAVALLERRRRWRWGAVAVAALGAVSLAATFTRSAWIGTVVALGAVVAGARPRWLPWLGVLLVAMVVLAPSAYRTRLASAFDPHHPTNVERTYMWQAGLAMFRDHPLTGVGLQDLKPVYDRYRSPAAHERAGHLHSVFFQILATMGLVGLAAFAWLVASLFRAACAGLPAMLRRGGLAAGLRLGVAAGLAGFLVAGLFEWNFGDEELLYLLYTLVGLAWAARHWDAPAHAAEGTQDAATAAGGSGAVRA